MYKESKAKSYNIPIKEYAILAKHIPIEIKYVKFILSPNYPKTIFDKAYANKKAEFIFPTNLLLVRCKFFSKLGVTNDQQVLEACKEAQAINVMINTFT